MAWLLRAAAAAWGRRAGARPEDAEAPGGAGPGPRPGPDWAGLPADLLVKVAKRLVAQHEAGWAAQLKRRGGTDSTGQRYWTEERIQKRMAVRKQDGICPLFVFALVCKPWRKAQLKVGGRLRTRVWSDVILPGQVELVKWALTEGCPGTGVDPVIRVRTNMAEVAAWYGHVELVKWLCGEVGFAMNELVVQDAAGSGNLELVQWLRGEGCPWDWKTCLVAVNYGHAEVLRWLRENGAPWQYMTRDKAAAELGYTDDYTDGESSDDEYGYDDDYADDDESASE